MYNRWGDGYWVMNPAPSLHSEITHGSSPALGTKVRYCHIGFTVYPPAVLILQSTMSQPRGTKRSFDELVHVMDQWYKQENDALSAQVLEQRGELKRLRRTVLVQTRNVDILRQHSQRNFNRATHLENQVRMLQNTLLEIFRHHPQIEGEYLWGLDTEEEILPDSDTE